MENLFPFAGIIFIVAIVFGILQIILFFKLWGMTNDVNTIKIKYLESLSNSLVSPGVIKNNSETKFTEGALVVNIKSGKQMRRKEFNAVTGKYSCYSNGGTIFEGDFDETEIKLFE